MFIPQKNADIREPSHVKVQKLEIPKFESTQKSSINGKIHLNASLKIMTRKQSMTTCWYPPLANHVGTSRIEIVLGTRC